MSWREDILGAFPPSVHRLTLAADPDGLLTEEGVTAELERRGYETLEYGYDSIAFRYAYERDYRSRWESGEEPCSIVLVRGEARDLDAVPYDLIRSGRKLSFGLVDLLPNLTTRRSPGWPGRIWIGCTRPTGGTLPRFSSEGAQLRTTYCSTSSVSRRRR